MTVFISRREFMQGLASVSLASAFRGCGDQATPSEPPVPSRTREKTVNFVLGSLMSRQAVSKLKLMVGSALYDLVPHTDETLADLPQTMLSSGTPTHFAKDVRFSVVGVQLFALQYVGDNGPPSLIHAGVHVPEPADLLASDDSEDPSLLVDDRQKAVWCVFQHPNIVAHDPAVAKAIIDVMPTSEGFDSLVKRIKFLGEAASLEDVETGYTGWIEARYLCKNDSDCGPNSRLVATEWVERLQSDGSSIVEEVEKQPRQYLYSWEPGEDLAPEILRVVEALQQVLYSNETFEKLGRYVTVTGVENVQPPSQTLLSASPSNVTLTDENRSRSMRRYNLNAVSSDSIQVQVTNHMGIGTMVGISYYDTTQTVTRSEFLGYVPATYYPSYFKPITSASNVTFRAPLVDSAYARIWTYSWTKHAGDTPPNVGTADAVAVFENAQDMAMAFQIIVDTQIPALMLLVGASSDSAQDVKQAFLNAVQAAGPAVFRAAFTLLLNQKLKEDGRGDIRSLGEAGQQAILPIAMGVLWGVAKFLGGELVSFFKTLLRVGVTSAATTAVPGVGWGTRLWRAAPLLIQAGMAAEAIFGERQVIASKLVYTHGVQGTITPEDSIAFPAYAARWALTMVADGHDVPFTAQGQLAPHQIAFSFAGVPIYVPLQITVMVYSAQGTVLTHHVQTFANVTAVGQEQTIAFAVKVSALPITARMQLKKAQTLSPTNDAALFAWTQASLAGDEQTDCRAALALCEQDGSITVSQKRGYVSANVRVSNASRAFATVGIDAPYPSVAGSAAMTTFDSAFTARVVHSLGDTHAVLVEDATLPANEGGVKVYGFAPGITPLASFTRSTAPTALIGQLFGRTIKSARIFAPTSHLVALTELGVEVLPLAANAETKSTLLVRRGTRRGQLSQPIAVSPLRDKRCYAVLESGNRRIQVFDLDGNPVVHFGRRDWLSLSTDPIRTYLDLEMDAAGNAWVLSTDPVGPILEIFLKNDASPLLSYRSVKALRFALDNFNQVYALNREHFPTRFSFPFATVTQWYPTES